MGSKVAEMATVVLRGPGGSKWSQGGPKVAKMYPLVFHGDLQCTGGLGGQLVCQVWTSLAVLG